MVFTREDMGNISTPIRRISHNNEEGSDYSSPGKGAIDNLRANSAAGPDGISPQVLKKLKNVIADHFHSYSIDPFRMAKPVPSEWRTVNITPICIRVPRGV
jgi:hypothetical protein